MSIHISAQRGDIAETVLLPGDPLRAEYVAREFLGDAVQYNRVRGMLGFTGMYEGRRVSVQGTGMGVPSALIYVHELIRDYGARQLIRIGSAGALSPDLELRSLVIAMSACTDSAFNRHRFRGADFAPTASFELLQKAVASARVGGHPVHVGSVITADEFYRDDPEYWNLWASYGVLCADMETAALYTVAARYSAQAVSLLTISDSVITGASVTAKEREHGLAQMVEVALGTLEQ